MDILDDMGVNKLSAKVFLKVNYSFKPLKLSSQPYIHFIDFNNLNVLEVHTKQLLWSYFSFLGFFCCIFPIFSFSCTICVFILTQSQLGILGRVLFSNKLTVCSASVLLLEITVVVFVCLRLSLCTYVCVMCDCQWEHIGFDRLLLALVQWCECVWPGSSRSLGPTQTADPPACCSSSNSTHTHKSKI